MKITEYQIIEAIDLLYRAKESTVITRLMNNVNDDLKKMYNKGREDGLEDCIKLLESLFKPQEDKKDEN